MEPSELAYQRANSGEYGYYSAMTSRKLSELGDFMSSGPPSRTRVKVSTTAAIDNEDQATPLKFNFDDLLHVLYGKKEGNTVDLLQLQKERRKERSKTYCVICHVDRPPNGCPFHEPSSTYTADHDESLSYAIKSFPAEVQLCTSSIPGAIFGVCAKRVIPEGTWIGPYEGRKVSPEELSVSRDNPDIWEIYEEGQPSYYIDGSDESASSWMRFIRCARHKEEQNLYAFQYLGNIFYRSFKEIARGAEMLVWYDDKYPQHLGIPTGLQEIEFVSSSDLVKSSNGDKTSNTTTVKSEFEGGLRLHVDREKDKVKEMDTHRSQKDYHTRLAAQPGGSHQRVMATSSPHRLRHSSYPTTTRISRAPHSLSSSPGFPTHDLLSLSSAGIPHATIPPHYTLSHLPLAPPLHSTTPPGVYGMGYRHPVPVNISAGIPVSMSGRGQLGITGTQLPRVHQEVLEEGPVIISSNSVVYSDHHYRPTSSTSPLGNINTLDRDSSLQRKRAFYSSTTSTPDALDEVGQQNIVTLKRKPTESATFESDTRQYPSLTKRKSPLTNIIEESSVESDKGWSNRPHMPKERLTEDQGSERIRDTKSHRPHLSKEEHVSKSSRVTPAWPADESPTQDEAAGESSDSNSTSSTKNEIAGIDEISMWRCRQCQKTFTQRVMLQVHVCPQQPLKPYRCGQCELSFATATELRSHVETHASEKPFKCGFCSRSFAGATTLNNHVRTHMGKRPFNCELCGKSFAQAGQLARHQRTPGECETRNTKS